MLFKLRLGLFIVGGLAIFVAAVFIIGKQQNYFDQMFRLSTTFKNVSGLEVGSNVRFTGINVGTVENIVIYDTSTVRVDMLIKENVQKYIKTDCIAMIGSSGIVGDRILSITQGSSAAPHVKDGEMIASKEPIETDTIISDLKDTVDKANKFVDKANTFVTGAEQIVNKVNNGHGTAAKLLNDPKMAQNINQTVINLKDATKTLDENMVAAKDSFLLRGAYRRQAKKEARARRIAEKQAAQALAEREKNQ
ncbi:MAG: organic solvent ABC transporter substrate-binding protein [Deltaproteobacteria bacterium CG11_big_fil_rev_8_21_14_0_20_47_16]|nr:MAG: organic solvent ABC transporter substrate-binding protein [Deltaproteobacteria bacterium CG11_big_fil_rev_8_21_14_0_20_47_16]